MIDSIQYQLCPFCGSEKIQSVLQVKDFTVSGETFPIAHCWNCSGRFTQNIPAQSSIGKYYQSVDYISHSETQQGFVNSLYHRVRKRTLNNKFELVRHYAGIGEGSILDLGCGTGAFLNRMKSGGWKVRGLEPDAGARSKAKELYGLDIDEPALLDQLPSASFNAITLWHVLEHVHALHDYLEQLKRLLAPSGAILIAVPNYTSFDSLQYQQYWAAYDVPRHLYHFSPDAMKKLLNSHGLKLEKMLPMWYDSFYVSLLSEKYRTGSSHLPRATLVGFLSNLKALGHVSRCSSVIYVVKS